MKPFSFIQLCDPQLGFGGYERDVNALTQAIVQINEMQVDFVVICGDLVDKATKESYCDFKRIIKDIKVPVYCAAGNHDIGDNCSSESLELFRKEIGKDYFSFTHKGYTFIVTNTILWKSSLINEIEKQDKWFIDILNKAKLTNSPVIIIGHNPLFIDTPEEGDKWAYFNVAKEKRIELLDLYTQNNVVAVLSGHTHWQVINEYKGIQMVSGETISKNFDKNPLGFRQWTIESLNKATHKFIELKELK